MRKRFMLLAAAMLFAVQPDALQSAQEESSPTQARAGATPAGRIVPYVPSSAPVVEGMLELARVGPDDTVYDLGCGDGRIVVTAAKQFGARGVGVDIDPQRIKEAKQNAQEAGVSERVRFVQQDFFNVDLQDASVVTLYLLPSVNVRLRAKLLESLKPGTRVVSHSFHMDDWLPNETKSINGSTPIFLWIIPANVSGSWSGTLQSEKGEKPLTLELHQEFQQVTGTLTLDEKPREVRDAMLRGDRLYFALDSPDADTPQLFEARLTGDALRGSMGSEGQASDSRQSWSATRRPGTARPLDTTAK